jgi:hypothetical protein
MEMHCPEEQFSLSSFATEPEIEGNEDAHAWRWDNWGTPKEAFETEIEVMIDRDEHGENALLDMHFETAWNPPWPIIEQVVRFFSDEHDVVNLQYWTEGLEMSSIITTEGGEIIMDRTTKTVYVEDRHSKVLKNLKYKREDLI